MAEGLSGRLRARAHVREVVGKGVCAGIVSSVCVLHLLPFCVGTGCWGVLGSLSSSVCGTVCWGFTFFFFCA